MMGIGGISAEGWLSASLCFTNLRKQIESHVKTVGQVLMIPALVYHHCYESQLNLRKDPNLSSYRQNESAAVLPLERIKTFNELLKVERPDPNDRRLTLVLQDRQRCDNCRRQRLTLQVQILYETRHYFTHTYYITTGKQKHDMDIYSILTLAFWKGANPCQRIQRCASQFSSFLR